MTGSRDRIEASDKAAVIATVHEADGRLLAYCEVRPSWSSGHFEVTRVISGTGALLAHHFSSRRGIVTVQVAGRTVSGRLVTAWKNSHRTWKIVPLNAALSLAG